MVKALCLRFLRRNDHSRTRRNSHNLDLKEDVTVKDPTLFLWFFDPVFGLADIYSITGFNVLSFRPFLRAPQSMMNS